VTWRKFCDFSYDKPDPVRLKAAGFEGVLMYLSRTPGKGMTQAIAHKFLNAGLAIGALYETTAGAALGGEAVGRAQAIEATTIAREIGYPSDCVIIYALDQDFSTAQMAGPVSAFVRGLHSVPGQDGEYGGYNQLNYLIKHNLADVGYLFQTYAWSGGKWLPPAQAPLQQYRNNQKVAGGTVDLCRVESSLHLWEPDMPLTNEDINKIVNAVWAHKLVTGETAGGGVADAATRSGTITNIQMPALSAQVSAISDQITALTALVQGSPAPAASTTPVLNAISALQSHVTALQATLTTNQAAAVPKQKQ
jgi:hypothetical protein